MFTVYKLLLKHFKTFVTGTLFQNWIASTEYLFNYLLVWLLLVVWLGVGRVFGFKQYWYITGEVDFSDMKDGVESSFWKPLLLCDISGNGLF